MTNAHDTNVNVLVGELVHQHMWRGKITQTQIAHAIGVGQPAIARKLRGERPFTIDELLTVAAYLDLPITELLPNRSGPHQGGPDGGDECPQPGSNRRPADYKSVVLTMPVRQNPAGRSAA